MAVAEILLVTFEKLDTPAVTVPLITPLLDAEGEKLSVKVAVPATPPVVAGTVIGLVPM